ncbi:MAG: ribosomal-processing cysteine protease Prp [Caldibacillus sp.]|mgnify:FL=1
MIRVTIERTPAKEIVSFTMTGHADFAEYGSDIVCAGVSAVAFGALNAVEALTSVHLDVVQGDDGGYLHCQVPSGLTEEKMAEVQLLLKGMVVALESIEREYSDYIKITFKQQEV